MRGSKKRCTLSFTMLLIT